MKRKYHTIDKQGRVNERKLREFLVHEVTCPLFPHGSYYDIRIADGISG